jgi:hypothetical protein
MFRSKEFILAVALAGVLIFTGCEHSRTIAEPDISSQISGSFQGESSLGQTVSLIVCDGKVTRVTFFSKHEYFGVADDALAVITKNQFSFSYGGPEIGTLGFSVSGTFKENEFYGTVTKIQGRQPNQRQISGTWRAGRSKSLLSYPNPIKIVSGRAIYFVSENGIGSLQVVQGPDSTIARIVVDRLNSDILQIIGIKEGNTAMVIQDSSVPPLLGKLNIAVAAN